MFNSLFGRDIPKSISDAAQDIQEIPLPKTQPDNELYRVGYTAEGWLTLTLMSTNGFSQTLSMTPEACERMIRMLRATYTEDEQQDGE